MIDLQIETAEGGYQSADMPLNASISMEDNSPLFATNVFEGTFSMPFTLPDTPANRRLFGFYNLMHRTGRPAKKYRARLFSDGLPILQEAEVTLRSTGSYGFKINIRGSISMLSEVFNTGKIADLFADLEWEIFEWTGSKFLTLSIEAAQVTAPLTIKINDTEYSSDSDLTDSQAILNSLCDRVNGSGLYTASNTHLDGTYTLQLDTLEAGLEAPFVVEASAFQYASGWGNSYSNALINALTNRMNTGGFHINASNRKMRFPVCYNAQQWEDDAYEKGASNTLNDTLQNGEFDLKHNSSNPNIKTALVPMVEVWNVFSLLRSKYNIRITGDYTAIPSELLFFNTQSINRVFEMANGEKYYSLHNKVRAADHLPDITIGELLMELKKLFGLSYTYDPFNQSLNISTISSTLQSQQEAKDITAKTSPEYELSYKEQAGFIAGYADPEDELWESTTVTVGDGTTDLRSKFAPTDMGTIYRTEPGTIFPKVTQMRGPKVSVPGGLYGKPAKIEPRLLFYWGPKPDSGGHNYEYASSDNVDRDGNILGEYSFSLQGEYSIYKLRQEAWAHITSFNDPVTRVLYWSFADLMLHNYNQVYRIEQVNYLVKNLSYSLSRKGLSPIKAELVRLDYVAE